MMNFSEKSEIVWQGKTYSYSEIDVMIDYVCQKIINIVKDDNLIIGFILNRSPLLISVIFALLKLNVTFVPIDIKCPHERKRCIIEQSGLKYCITDISVDDGLLNYIYLNINDIKSFKNNKQNLYKLNTNNELSYIAFTSGSSGEPKGVKVCKKGLENFISSIPKIINLHSYSKILCMTNYVFDIFFLESILAGVIGLKIYLADNDEIENIRKIKNLLINNEIEIVQITPSRLELLNLIDPEFISLKKVKIIMIGGEVLPNNLFTKVKSGTNALIYNMYGPVETTIWSSIADLTNFNTVHLGKPIANTEIMILDSNNKILPHGFQGQIAISGEGLSAGYLNNDELTKQKFINLNDKIVYLTGDYGYIDNYLFYLGRKDNQVKIRGFRVELEGIENVIKTMFDSIIVAVCYVKDNNNDKLIAFYQSKNVISMSSFNKKLINLLPKYMIPNIYIKVESMPYTKSHKIDKRALLNQYF